MFYHDKRTQYKVRVEKPNPAFARMLQQAIGGIEGEMRVCLQYLFQAWNSRGPAKYRDMLLDTGTEEISHIEMLATAVALNLEGAPLSVQEAAIGQDGVVGAVLGGMNPRSFLSAGLGALAFDAEGVPFSGAYVVGSGNLMMLGFMIARDTMHQQQWLAVIEELGGNKGLPIPNSFPQMEKYKQFDYAFISPGINDAAQPASGRWTHGESLDGKGEFHVLKAEPYGDEPKLGPPVPKGHAQKEQMTTMDNIIGNIKDTLS